MMALSLIYLFLQVIGLFWLIYGAQKISKVQIVSKESFLEKDLPSLSIVVPARNEEKTLAIGLESLIKLSYPNLEIIIVNDRSTDQTAKILGDFLKRDDRLKSLNVAELPAGWLGKNHALNLGSKASGSEFILFTDADVEIEDKFLKSSVSFIQKNKLDHLAAIPRVTGKNPFLYPLLGVFGLAFSLFTRPWEGKDPKKGKAVGIGAFNLVRRSAYVSIGEHKRIALRPDDDLKLALLFKRNGFRTDCVNGVDGLRVEWYSTFKELMLGLEKNVMSGFEYSFKKAIFANSVFAFIFLFPFGLFYVVHGTSFYLLLVSVFTLLLSYGAQLHQARMPLWCIPLFPFAATGILFIFLRACLLTFRNQGVFWRGTFYPLEDLRSNRFD